MEVRIEPPDDIGRCLESEWGDVPKHALKTLAIEGYRARALSRAQVRRVLGFETRTEVDEFLARRGVPFDYTVEDFEHDGQASGYLAEIRDKDLQWR